MKVFYTFIVLLACLILSSRCLAQLDSTSATFEKLNKKIHELQNRKASLILSYYRSCIGDMVHVQPRDSCIAYDTKYLFWMIDDKCYIQRFDECKTYDSVGMVNSFVDFVSGNLERLKHANIKQPLFRTGKGKNSLTTVFIDHTCFSIFYIFSRNNIFIKKLSDFDLETKKFDGRLNTNYLSNQKSILNKLKVRIEKETAIYDKNLFNKKGAQ